MTDDRQQPGRNFESAEPGQRGEVNHTREVNPRWSARAGVPPPWANPHPAGSEPGGAQGRHWDPEDDRYEQRWWLPIVFGLVALLLLAVLAFGIWLIVRAWDAGTPPPIPTTTSATESPSAPPTTAATTRPPSAGPTTPAGVVMPSLVGLPQDLAQSRLDQLGLNYRLRFRPSRNQAAGTVLATDPEAGAPVRSGEAVILVIAEAPDGHQTGVPTAPPTTPPTRFPFPTLPSFPPPTS